jgi:hypothetical protein
MKLKLWSLSLAMAIILGMFTAGFASQPPSPINAHLFSWRTLSGMNLFSGRTILRTKNEIELSQQQQEKIEDLMLSFEEYSISQGAAIKIKELRLARYLKSASLNRRQLEGYVREISTMKIDFSVVYLNYLLDLRAILSQDQLHQLVVLRRKTIKNARSGQHRRTKNVPPIAPLP